MSQDVLGDRLEEFRRQWLDEEFDLSPKAVAGSRIDLIVVPDFPIEDSIEFWLGSQSATWLDAFVYDSNMVGRYEQISPDLPSVQRIFFEGCAEHVTLTTSKRHVMHKGPLPTFHLVGVPQALTQSTGFRNRAVEQWAELLADPMMSNTERLFIERALAKYSFEL